MIKVSSARFHLGVQLGADVKTGLSEKVNSCLMELEPSEGIYITKLNKKDLVEPIFIPNSMVNCAYLKPDSYAEYLKAQDRPLFIDAKGRPEGIDAPFVVEFEDAPKRGRPKKAE